MIFVFKNDLIHVNDNRIYCQTLILTSRTLQKLGCSGLVQTSTSFDNPLPPCLKLLSFHQVLLGDGVYIFLKGKNVIIRMAVTKNLLKRKTHV